MKIIIEIQGTNVDPSVALDAAHEFADEFTSEHGGTVSEEDGITIVDEI